MKTRSTGTYEIADREIVASGSDMRVQILGLSDGQSVPWHHHSEITDSFVGLDGVTVIETRAPDDVISIGPGQRHSVAPGITHTVHGADGGPCRFLVIQGVGVYDFIPDSV